MVSCAAPFAWRLWQLSQHAPPSTITPRSLLSMFSSSSFITTRTILSPSPAAASALTPTTVDDTQSGRVDVTATAWKLLMFISLFTLSKYVITEGMSLFNMRSYSFLCCWYFPTGRHEVHAEDKWLGLASQLMYTHLPLLGIALLLSLILRRNLTRTDTLLTSVLVQGLVPMGLLCVSVYRVAQLFDWIEWLPPHYRGLLPRSIYVISGSAMLLSLVPRGHALVGRALSLFAAPLPALVLLLGPRSCAPVLMLLTQLYLLSELERDLTSRTSARVVADGDSSWTAVLLVFMAYYFYYVTGHDIGISSLHMEAGYYGIEVIEKNSLYLFLLMLLCALFKTLLSSFVVLFFCWCVFFVCFCIGRNITRCCRRCLSSSTLSPRSSSCYLLCLLLCYCVVTCEPLDCFSNVYYWACAARWRPKHSSPCCLCIFSDDIWWYVYIFHIRIIHLKHTSLHTKTKSSITRHLSDACVAI